MKRRFTNSSKVIKRYLRCKLNSKYLRDDPYPRYTTRIIREDQTLFDSSRSNIHLKYTPNHGGVSLNFLATYKDDEPYTLKNVARGVAIRKGSFKRRHIGRAAYNKENKSLGYIVDVINKNYNDLAFVYLKK